MIRRLGLCFVLATAGACVVAASGWAGEDLIAFDRTKISAAKTVCDLMVIAKLDNRAVALLKDGHLDRLESIDHSAVLVDASTDIEQLWVAGRNQDRPEPPGILLSTRNFHLLKLSYSEAQNLMASGVRLSKCQRVDLPSDPPFFVPAKPRSRGALITDIDSLMASSRLIYLYLYPYPYLSCIPYSPPKVYLCPSDTLSIGGFNMQNELSALAFEIAKTHNIPVCDALAIISRVIELANKDYNT